MDNYDRKNPLYMEFVARGALDWQAKYLTVRLSTAFGQDLRGLLDNFWKRGWRAPNIWELDRNNKAWRKQTQSLFVINDMLAALGCPVYFTAIILASACLFRPENSDQNRTENIALPRTVWESICAMRQGGYNDEQILVLLSGYPMAFLNTRERILEWCRDTKNAGGHYYLTIRELTRHPRRTQVGKSLTHALALEREADMPRVEQMLPPEIPPTTESLRSDAPIVPEPANSVIISEAPKTEVVGLDPMSATLPVDVIPESQPEHAPADSVIVIHESPSPESKTEKVKETEVRIPAPPPVPKIPVIKRVTSLPPIRTFKASEPPQPKEPLPPPYQPEDLAHNWPVLANVILAHAVPDWSQEKWKAWVEKNTWINFTRSPETKALEQLFSWVVFSTASPPHDRRVKLIASVLLGNDLITKPKPKRKRDSDKPTDPKFALDQILKLSEEALYFRFYVLRRIVMRPPERHPDALTYPFEQVEKFELPNGKQFSVPPPHMDDENSWKAKAAELRWRVHEIERRGRNYQCGLKPFVLMLFTPKRKSFLKRLDRYEAENGTVSRPALRRNNSMVTPFSSLA